MDIIKYRPIGIIHSPYKEPKGVPIQSSAAKEVNGSIEVYPEYAAGLIDIEGFSHIILLFHFHLSRGYSLKVKPYLDDELHGLFVTRAPSRPNPIGLSVVRLIRRENNMLFIRNVDVVDGTPLLDIKPFVPDFNPKEEYRIGWLQKHIHKLHKTRDNGRFMKQED